MKYTTFIADQLEEVYSGDPWLGVSFQSYLLSMTAEEALREIGTSNNAWQLVNHVIYWHQRAMRVIQLEELVQEGDIPDFYLPEHQTEENWQITLQQLQQSFKKTADIIRNFPEEDLEKQLSNSDNSAIYHIHGLLDHDAYHLGQIVWLRKYAV
ncbi:DinB family protein [Flavobacterium sp. '19STA2R22 D10 B1']|uniref:DinB family protein n=1 Tax=Flavobacterium aerium TaxID=3037261 RepID=UPI00278BEEB9|nr:DinB family protein [Flavobacterium sp. '19STA2R22 D10 B1']